MKILQVVPRFHPYVGGVENVAYYLSKELVKSGHRVKVICANEPAVGDGVIEHIEVKRLNYVGKIGNTNITLGLGKAILAEDFDIIHAYFPTPWSADFSAILSLLKHKPLFLTYCNDITGTGINKFIAELYNFTALRFLLKKAQKIFILHKSYFQHSKFLTAFMDKIIPVSPGVDTDKFRPLNLAKLETNTIFFLSKLDQFHRYKGLDYLLLSIKRIKDKLPLKLFVGGEGSLLGYYKKIVEEYGLEGQVSFLGYLNDEELLKYYNLCDIFVLPSISAVQEGFGLVALEAMACKKPVIITDIVGIAEDVIKYNAGMVVRRGNAEELSGAILFLLSNEKAREEMGANGYSLVKSLYTWQRYANIIGREYLKIMKS